MKVHKGLNREIKILECDVPWHCLDRRSNKGTMIKILSTIINITVFTKLEKRNSNTMIIDNLVRLFPSPMVGLKDLSKIRRIYYFMLPNNLLNYFIDS